MALGHCSDCGQLVHIRPSGPGAWRPLAHPGCDGHERTLRSPGYQHPLPADYDGPGKRGPSFN